MLALSNCNGASNEESHLSNAARLHSAMQNMSCAYPRCGSGSTDVAYEQLLASTDSSQVSLVGTFGDRSPMPVRPERTRRVSQPMNIYNSGKIKQYILKTSNMNNYVCKW